MTNSITSGSEDHISCMSQVLLVEMLSAMAVAVWEHLVGKPHFFTDSPTRDKTLISAIW